MMVMKIATTEIRSGNSTASSASDGSQANQQTSHRLVGNEASVRANNTQNFASSVSLKWRYRSTKAQMRILQ